jgi:hypothetical protein
MMRRARTTGLGARAALMTACLLLLTGWSWGPAVTYFEETGGIQRAIDKLHAKGGFERVLSIEILGDRVIIDAQDTMLRDQVNRWTITKQSISRLNWEETDGPEPAHISVTDGDLEANLFDLEDVDISVALDLAKASIAKAALQDEAAVSSMDIRRQRFILPAALSGDVRWVVNLRSNREHARVFADAKGRIAGLDLEGTERARTFNILAALDRLPEAAEAFAHAVGTGAVLSEVDVSQRSATFKTNITETSPLFASLKQSQVYTWSVNGLQRSMSTMDTSEFFGPDPAFAAGDVDWAAAGRLAKQAKTRLGMPGGKLTDVEIEKPKDQAGPPRVEWQIDITDLNGEKGTARFDAKSGEPLGVRLPESRRRPFDARDPARWPDLLAQIKQTFGPDSSIAELMINESQVAIVASDPQKPSELGNFLLDDDGIERFGSVSPFAAANPRFTLREIEALTGDQMRKLTDATIARLKLPVTQIINITVSKASLDPSPHGNVTVEIRAEEGRNLRSGRVNWEIDGREIKAYLP